MQGRIIKGIAGFYYVYTDEYGVLECKAKGGFRREGIRPLVGDIAEVDIISTEDRTGNIVDIVDRSNVLIRPASANVEQALIIFALSKPEPNFVTLDKMIVQYLSMNIPVTLVFNKTDLVNDEYVDEVVAQYNKSGCRIILSCAKKGIGISDIMDALKGRLTIVAGPSGAGKSSIINCLTSKKVTETGDISDKLKRGKHTTRHSEIFPLSDNTFIMDTPGFSSFDLFDIEKEDLADYYEEFRTDEACRFIPCSHTHEPGCIIKGRVRNKIIPAKRYENYVQIYNELSQIRRY